MHQQFLLSVQVTEVEADPALDRLDAWFFIERPDGFADCTSFNPHVWADEDGQRWACVGFPAADQTSAAFMASLALQECGLDKNTHALVLKTEVSQ